MKIFFSFLSGFLILYFLWDVLIKKELFIDKYYMLIIAAVSAVLFLIVKKVEDKKGENKS
jgi:hypothetical protein